MGCDIHGWVEVYDKDKWVGVYNFDSFHEGGAAGGRNYGRFAALAGVRGAGPEALGPPSDMSDSVEYDYRSWLGDAHSASHLTLEEFASRCALADGVTYGYDYVEWTLFPELFPIEGEKYRVVFWFDN